MDKFLDVIKGIDWDQLHRQKYQILQVIDDAEKIFGAHDNELLGVVNLIDELQDVASKLRIWEFPHERFEGECPDCNSRNYEILEEEEDKFVYECYDCGETFYVDKENYVAHTLAICTGCGKEEYWNCIEEIDGKAYCETCAPKKKKGEL